MVCSQGSLNVLSAKMAARIREWMSKNYPDLKTYTDSPSEDNEALETKYKTLKNQEGSLELFDYIFVRCCNNIFSYKRRPDLVMENQHVEPMYQHFH